ncbi:MAG TPA: CDP-archaeol synthase [Blastocatellia bacterium]|nr:CDP-archaeol synthase [Blastocatellia bacterium]
MNELLRVSWLLSPLLVGLAFHGLCIKFNWLGSLGRPIDNGRTFRGKRLFGDNKTWRGIVAVGLGTAAGFGLQAILHSLIGDRGIDLVEYSWAGAIALGFAVGVAAMLSELPNSFIKRQSGITPGAAGKGVAGLFFYFLDQIDLLIGIWLVLALVIPVTIERVLWSVVFLFLAHQFLTVVGYSLGMRATARQGKMGDSLTWESAHTSSIPRWAVRLAAYPWFLNFTSRYPAGR